MRRKRIRGRGSKRRRWRSRRTRIRKRRRRRTRWERSDKEQEEGERGKKNKRRRKQRRRRSKHYYQPHRGSPGYEWASPAKQRWGHRSEPHHQDPESAWLCPSPTVAPWHQTNPPVPLVGWEMPGRWKQQRSIRVKNSACFGVSSTLSPNAAWGSWVGGEQRVVGRGGGARAQKKSLTTLQIHEEWKSYLSYAWGTKILLQQTPMAQSYISQAKYAQLWQDLAHAGIN